MKTWTKWRRATAASVSLAIALGVSGCQRGASSGSETVVVDKNHEDPPPKPPPTLPVLPDPAPAMTSRWLDQGWDDAVRARVHHATQGSATFPLPYEWLVALEQPSVTPAQSSPLLVEPDYLSRFGFVASTVDDPNANPDGLPVGFARTAPFESPVPGGLNPNPATGEPYAGVGFTCAACHTGQLEYGGTRLLIDGGPATTNLGAFRTALQLAVQGLADEARARRFMGRVLSSEATPEQRLGLQAQIQGFGRATQAEVAATTAAIQARIARGEPMVDEGFARLDALARIGNQVFWTDQRRSAGVTGPELNENFALPNAPVNFPPIWDAPWFDWVQYNSSIMQPMFRNFSEALGVGAQINLGDDPTAQLLSTVDVRSLHQMERDIAGPPPFPKRKFQGLRSPHWPEDVLGAINTDLAEEGAELYAERCQECHLPPPSSQAFWTKDLWRRDPGAAKSANRYLKLDLVPLEKIGTDPAQAHNLRARTIKLPRALGGETVSYGEALTKLTKAIDKAYDAADVPEPEREAFGGGRPPLVRAELGYRPRPLNGIWATPPFLHNGSVANLYQLLSPVAERDKVLYLGSRTFDPEKLGFAHARAPGLFELDTSLPGNRNTGHEFADREAEGVLGPELSEHQRMALIEFIKTL